MDAVVALKVNAKLGEAAIWDIDNQKLYWVDIEGRSFNIFDPASGENRFYQTGKRIGTVVPINADTVLVALEDGIATIDIQKASIDYVLKTDIHKVNNQRFNDGKCDPRGRFWVGTLSMDGVAQKSSLFCINKDFNLSEKLTGISISNGIAWSIDGSLMYYIDTPTSEVIQFDYDLESGTIGNRKTIIKIAKEDGYPDGMTIDSQGMLWVALWDGFGVIQIDPSNGNILRKINLPVPKVTSCAFGGPDLDQLYITTASVEMTEEELIKYPLSGSVFTANVKVTGLPPNHFIR